MKGTFSSAARTFHRATISETLMPPKLTLLPPFASSGAPADPMPQRPASLPQRLGLVPQHLRRAQRGAGGELALEFAQDYERVRVLVRGAYRSPPVLNVDLYSHPPRRVRDSRSEERRVGK